MVRDLTAKGYPGVRMIQAEIPGRGTWYRIRMGAFDRREDAEGWAKQVRDRERMQPQLVVEKN
jgi:cell division protein FtsN